MGYATTIFEALSVPGGMLAIGIPAYRLPKEVLNKEIEKIKDVGVRIELNNPIRSIDVVLKKGYEAVFVSTGAHRDLKLNVPGEDKKGVLGAVAFLRQINLGKPLTIGSQVVVVGGGNAAIDSARVAIRKGAKRVFILYRRSRKEMPATDEEIQASEEEGVKVIYQAVPVQILGVSSVSGVECVRTKLGKRDASGRARPLPIKGSEFVIDADTVIEALGQIPEPLSAEEELVVSAEGRISVDPETLSTSKPGVFAGGDAVTGPSYVPDAVGAGKQAAVSIDRYLKGEPLKVEVKKRPVVGYEELCLDGIPSLPRAKAVNLEAPVRVDGFAEVEGGFAPAIAVGEAKRCLSCNPFSERCILSFNCPAMIRDKNGKSRIIDSLCNGCGVCADLCPHKAIVKEESK
jgi:NADPH-dependent glutamate synthase beta subunit-like oxidoreductase